MEKEFALLGRVVLNDKILKDGAVIVEEGIISDVGNRCDMTLPEKKIDTQGKLIAPGFVDIHCHAGGQHWAYENPRQMAKYHLKHGTTGLLCTLYRDLSYENTIKAIEKIKTAMQTEKNILGVHMEGPYLNPKYGAGEGMSSIPNRAEYMEIIKSGIIKQWTFSPELDKTDEFLEDIKEAGIIASIGHSEASPKRVYEVCKNGVKIITHLTNATGSSISPTRYVGTLETSFDHAALLCDSVYYEIICDKNGVHIRHDLIKLMIKTVGIDKIVGITDACIGSEDDIDVNIVNGELMGSKLTMQNVAQNFLRLGLGICDVIRIASYNPSCAIGIDGITGSIEEGKMVDLIITDDLFDKVEVNNQIFEIVREEIEKRTDSKIIEEKCALLHEKIEGIKKEIQQMQLQKQAASSGNGRLREICEALDELGTEFKEYNDIVTRRLISRIRVVTDKKIIITFCGCMDIEQIL